MYKRRADVECLFRLFIASKYGNFINHDFICINFSPIYSNLKRESQLLHIHFPNHLRLKLRHGLLLFAPSDFFCVHLFVFVFLSMFFFRLNTQKLRMIFAVLLLLAPSVLAQCGVGFINVIFIVSTVEIFSYTGFPMAL